MAKALVVAEKPSVARDIAQALGGFTNHDTYLESDQFVVSWAVGHLLELEEPEEIDPKYKRWLLEDLPIIPETFKMKVKQGQSDRVRTLKKLGQRSDVTEFINACDAGREGELIFRELQYHFALPKPVRRLWLQSMTMDAIRTGFGNLHPGSDYDGLGDAAQCRSEADWLIGMNATRALTRRMKTRTETTAWSAGRVQTPTLALLVDRELEIARHRSQPFWRVVAQFKATSHGYQGTWFDPTFKANEDSPRKDDWVTDEKQLNEILAAVRGQTGEASETRKTSRENAPPLFDLTSLQREANRRFGYSARRTLAAAQRLYEAHKLLTYPRTDSRCLPNDYKEHVNTVLTGWAGASGDFAKAAQFLRKNGLKNESRVFDDSKVSDHFAIIPTEQRPSEGQLSGDDEKVYDLVMRRFLAAFYPPAEWLSVERITKVKTHHFRTRARFLKVPGWYEVYGRESTEDKALPPLDAMAKEEEALTKELSGETSGFKGGPRVEVRTEGAEAEADKTRPPARINEGRLLSLMEHAGQQVEDDAISDVMKGKGLGTPATRAEIIENLVAKQYARRAEKGLRATPKGILLIDLLRRIHVDRLASARLTGELEKHLQEVEQNLRTRKDFMREIEAYAREIVERAKTFSYEELYKDEPPLGECPICGKGKVREQSRFYSCEHNTGKDSECRMIVWKEKNGRYIDRTTMAELLTTGETVELDGFLTSQGKGYSASLRLNQGVLELAGDRTGAVGEDVIAEDAQPLCDCPEMEGCRVFETGVNYRCEGKCLQEGARKKVGVILPKVICQREITVEEALAYFKEGRTAEIPDFISRFGRPFAATLIRQPNGRHGFEFKPRPGREPKEGEAARTPRTAKKKSKAAAKKKKAPAATTKVAAATKSAPKATAAAKPKAKKKAASKSAKKKDSVAKPG